MLFRSNQVERAFKDVAPTFFNIRKFPIADGGDETANILINALHLNEVEVTVLDPLDRLTVAKYGYANGTAVIEMANASGLKLLNLDELNPMKSSSFGTGEFILDAISRGARKIYVGIGGSATVDGGMGMLEAMGFQFRDKLGQLLSGNGENLGIIHEIIASNCFFDKDVEIIVISDVDNLLLGETGAARIFGPQKGASQLMVEQLEANLTHYANIIKETFQIDVTDFKGGGAAGGISVAFSTFLNAKIMSGADFILDIINIDKQIAWADLVITGEGMIDNQTLMNKAPYAVAMRAKKQNKPVIAIAGSVSLSNSDLFDGLFSIVNKPMSLEEAMSKAPELVYFSSIELARLIYKLECKTF